MDKQTLKPSLRVSFKTKKKDIKKHSTVRVALYPCPAPACNGGVSLAIVLRLVTATHRNTYTHSDR